MIIVQPFLLKIELLHSTWYCGFEHKASCKKKKKSLFPGFLLSPMAPNAEGFRYLSSEMYHSPPHSHFNTQYSLLDITFLVVKSPWACCKTKQQQKLKNNMWSLYTKSPELDIGGWGGVQEERNEGQIARSAPISSRSGVTTSEKRFVALPITVVSCCD